MIPDEFMTIDIESPHGHLIGSVDVWTDGELGFLMNDEWDNLLSKESVDKIIELRQELMRIHEERKAEGA